MEKMLISINFRVFSENDLKYLKKACARAYLAASAEKSQKLRFFTFSHFLHLPLISVFLRKSIF